MKNRSPLVLLLVLGLVLPSCHCSAQDAAPIPQPTGIGDIVTNVPQTESFTNSTVEFDTGLLALGVGQTTDALAFMRGTYNWNQHFYTAVEMQLGAGNVLNGAVLYPFGIRKPFDNAELFGGIGPKYDWEDRTVKIVFSGGARWNIFSALGATPGTVWANIAVGAEMRSEVALQNTVRPAIGLNGFATYKW